MSSGSGIVADIGGTYARFAMAKRDEAGGIILSHVSKLKTADFPTFDAAYRNYIATSDQTPRQGVFAVASPIVGDEVKLTNSSWSIRPSTLASRLDLSQSSVVNDFYAIAKAIPHLPESSVKALSESFELPESGTVSIVGPGSGVGVAMLSRSAEGDRVLASEGGHMGFAPADEIDAFILRFAQKRFSRVSAERLISGSGLSLIYEALAVLDGGVISKQRPENLWQAAIEKTDAHAVRASERWLMMLGSFAGDVALTHGARSVVLAGGILPRFGEEVNINPLLSRFYAKGRFESMMRDIPVALIRHPEPGLIGAASLFKL